MPTFSATIPTSLQSDVDAALDWFNRDQAVPFEVTGILDPELALSTATSSSTSSANSPGAPRELKLVLCGGDRCEQRSFRVSQGVAGPEVDFLEDGPAEGAGLVAGEKQAELDPPPGPHRGWLDRTLDRHAFSVILFYRGFW